MKCPVCQADMPGNTRLCGRCGCELPEHIPLEEVVAPTAEPDLPPSEEADTADTIVVDVAEAEKAPAVVKPIVIAAAMLAAVIATAVLSWLFCFEQVRPFVFYLKDGGLMLYHMQDEKLVELSADAYGEERMALYYREPLVSDDGKTVFFAQNYSINYSTYTPNFDLYYTKAEALDKTPVKVATAVRTYMISSDGGAVVYIDNSDTLYYDDLKNKEKLAYVGSQTAWTDARALLSADGQRVVFLNAGGELYEYGVGGEVQKIADGVKELYAPSSQLDTLIYYDEHLTLYKKSGDAEPEIIADAVAALPPLAQSTFYFYTPASYQVPLMSFVEDDIDFPVGGVSQPTYPDRVNHGTYQEYLAAVAAYYKAQDEYIEFMRVQDLREELHSTSYTPPSCYDLYYYNGTEAQLVCASVDRCRLDINETQTLLVDQYCPERVGKVNLSQITAVGDLTSALQSTFSTVRQTVLVRDGVAVATDIDRALFSMSDDSGSKLVYAEKTADAYEVYYAVLSGTAFEQRTHILTMPSLKASVVTMADGSFVYTVGGKLFCDGEEIDDDVSSELILSADRKTVAYGTAYDSNKNTVALKLYKSGQRPIKIAEDVRDIQFEANGRVVYLANCDNDEGDLMVYQDGKSREIDSGVVKLMDYDVAAEQYGLGSTRYVSFAK